MATGESEITCVTGGQLGAVCEINSDCDSLNGWECADWIDTSTSPSASTGEKCALTANCGGT